MDPLGAGYLLRVLLALAVVLVLAAGSLWGLRRIGRFAVRDSGELRIVASLAVGPRERLLVVEADGNRLLVGVAPGSVRLLASLGDDPTGFTQVLRGATAVSRREASP